jgi:S1-C subfamily serine protease
MLIDLLIVLLVISSVIRNWGSGFSRQFWAVFGFGLGLVLGRTLETYTLKLVHTPLSRALVTIITILGVGLIGLTIGEYIGVKLKLRWLTGKFNETDNALGSILTVVTALLSIWLIAAVIGSLPATKLKGDIQGSHIIAALNKLLPPAPNVISDLGKLIDPNGFPDVFVGNEPAPTNVNLPSLREMTPAINADTASVVKIEGTGCGGVITGSGFVVRDGLVVTNAHVVAGIDQPYIEDSNGHHAAKVIAFDPNLDLAVLRATNLAGKPLTIDLGTISQGTPGAVLGYPGGGPFSSNVAAVMDEFNASGHNIYGTGLTLRDVYEIDANVIPGNSGGPLITDSGSVMGVVFAESTTYSHVGYALAMTKVSSEINKASLNHSAVSTGQCAE